MAVRGGLRECGAKGVCPRGPPLARLSPQEGRRNQRIGRRGWDAVLLVRWAQRIGRRGWDAVLLVRWAGLLVAS